MTAAPFSGTFRTLLWLGFFGLILFAWFIMYKMAQMSGVDGLGRPVGMNMMPMTTFGALFPMWAIMMAAMMLPTMVPTLTTYERLMVSADGTRAGWIGVFLGYGIAWVGFAAIIAIAQVGLIGIGVIDTLGAATPGLLTAALFVIVGLFQFSRTKEVCHGVCHAPMTFFLGHWRRGFSGGLSMGLRLGSFCVGCCWGFMVLGFAGGVMSLLWMGLATVFMIFEKLPQIGHHLIKPAGWALILAGIVTAGFSLQGA